MSTYVLETNSSQQGRRTTGEKHHGAKQDIHAGKSSPEHRIRFVGFNVMSYLTYCVQKCRLLANIFHLSEVRASMTQFDSSPSTKNYWQLCEDFKVHTARRLPRIHSDQAHVGCHLSARQHVLHPPFDHPTALLGTV